MAKFASASVLDGGTDLIRTLAGTVARVKMHLVKAYAVNDSYATIITNSLGSVDLVAADLPSSANVLARRTTFAAKAITLTASSGAGPDLHIVVVDSVGSVPLVATDETTNQVVTMGNTFNVPSWTFDSPQLV